MSVRHRNEIRKVVVLMVPGLERDMFELKADGKKRNKKYIQGNLSPDDYYPEELKLENLPENMKPFAEMFKYLWPCKTPGDDRMSKMHSPLQAMLTAPLPKSQEEKKAAKNKKGVQQAKEPSGWNNKRTPITEFILTAEELLEHEYVAHPAAFDSEDEKAALEDKRRLLGVSTSDGWVDTLVNRLEDGTVPDNEVQSGSLTAGREIYAVDCEMCKTSESDLTLTRISILDWSGSVVMDELVKPDTPITDYVTMYSGITEEMLKDVTTTLADIQKKLLDLLGPRSILLGHSLNSDLKALKITHPFIIDTGVAFPHQRGPPLKNSLKFLAQKYLNREVQKGTGGMGHDSIEDARTCLDLIKQKCEKGKDWGSAEVTGESIFKRVTRAGVRYKNQGSEAVPTSVDGKTSAAVDWGNPKKGVGSSATHVVGCENDADVVKGVIRAVNGDQDGSKIPGGGVDFVWARLRELEALKGWWNNNKISPMPAQPTLPIVDTLLASPETDSLPVDDGALKAFIESEKAKASLEILSSDQAQSTRRTLTSNALPPPPLSSTPIATATATLVAQLSEIYAALPPCTAFIIYSGSGDPREMSRMQAMNATFKREYKTKKWDQLSVKWTDTEEQELKRAARDAREGIAFIAVK